PFASAQRSARSRTRSASSSVNTGPSPSPAPHGAIRSRSSRRRGPRRRSPRGRTPPRRHGARDAATRSPIRRDRRPPRPARSCSSATAARRKGRAVSARPVRYAAPAMEVSVIGGTGEEGFGLVLRLAKAGYHVTIGSRSQEKGAAAAERARGIVGEAATVDGTTNEEAAAASEVVAVTVPFAGQADIYRAIKPSVKPGSIVLDATSPLATAVGGRAWQV